VQILVVVANIQVRTLKAEVEKGFARTAFDRESVDPEAQINLVNSIIGPKGGGNSFFGSNSSYAYYAERESGLIFLNLDLDSLR
jgi:hypothetical protein